MTKIRNRYGVAIFRRFFDRIVEQCQQAGLVWGKELYFDSTQVETNADRDKMMPRFYVDAVNDHLVALFPEGDRRHEQDLVRSAEPASMALPLDLPPEVEAELAARHDWIAELGRPDRAETHGSYQRQSDIWVNTTDPAGNIGR